MRIEENKQNRQIIINLLSHLQLSLYFQRNFREIILKLILSKWKDCMLYGNLWKQTNAAIVRKQL